MCGRFLMFGDDEYDEIMNIINMVDENQRSSIAELKNKEIYPTSTVPIVACNDKNKKIIELSKWGFPNFKAPSQVIINARSETLEERVTFKKIMYTKRCIIPSAGFYEWKAGDRKKEKYLIKPQDHKLFYMAGLYNSFVSKHGEAYNAFVVITTEANSQMAVIHDRMPILFTSEEECSGWINPQMNKLLEIKTFLRPYQDQLTIKNISEQLRFSI